MAFLTACVVTIVATPLSLIFIRKWKLFDDPKTHKHPAVIHKKPVPRGGGIALFLGVWITVFLFIPFTSIIAALFLASLCAVIIGTLDDKLDISPYLRFFTNVIVASIVVGSGIGIPYITNPLGGIIHLDTISLFPSVFGIQTPFVLSNILGLLWIIWVMNMLNWSKGVDGIMPGVVAISALIIGIVTLRFTVADTQNLTAAYLSFIIAGAAIGFLPFNFYPARIFPGYGATGFYLLLGVVAILSSAKLAIAILVMGVPMVDALFTIIRRIASGKSPFWHDKKHLYHILLDRGIKHRSIALFYWGISAILGTLSLMLSSKGKLFAILMLGVIVSGILLFLHRALRGKDDEIIT